MTPPVGVSLRAAPDPLLVRLGMRLRRIRHQRGLSQRQVATAAGFADRTSIALIEGGKADVGVRRLVVIARLLDVDPGELLDQIAVTLSRRQLAVLPVWRDEWATRFEEAAQWHRDDAHGRERQLGVAQGFELAAKQLREHKPPTRLDRDDDHPHQHPTSDGS